MALPPINKTFSSLCPFYSISKASAPFFSIYSHPKTLPSSVSALTSSSTQYDTDLSSHPACPLDSSTAPSSVSRGVHSSSFLSNSSRLDNRSDCHGSPQAYGKRYSKYLLFSIGLFPVSAGFHSEKHIDYRGSCLGLSLSNAARRNYVRWLSGPSSNTLVAPDDHSKSGSRNCRFMRSDHVKISKLVKLVREDGGNLLKELDSLNITLSLAVIYEVFRVLNCEKVSLLRFFEWIRLRCPKYRRNSDICSLVVDNCGWLGDYDSMICLLNDFNSEHIPLSRKAFGFVPLSVSSESGTISYVEKLIELLDKVGGMCRGSGVVALIEMFSLLGLYDMCKFVMEKTEKRVSYYGIMVKDMCRQHKFDGVLDILDEMKQVGCEPNSNIYNYVFSYLCRISKTDKACKVLEEMIERGLQPDGLTYEILIWFSCRHENLDDALAFYDKMVSSGIVPRLTTHDAFIKTYFYQKQYEEAHRYVINKTDEHTCSSNRNYGSLINLHRKRGNLVIAHEILSEMIRKGLRPDSLVYKRLRKCLQKSGREDLAKDIEMKLSSLSLRLHLEAG